MTSTIALPHAELKPAELRALAAEQGAVRVRGLELQDTAAAEAVFRQFGTLMTEREVLAPRQQYAPGVYSSTKWPPNQPMCMHHELSYALEVPGLMLFACLVAPETGGATPVADASAVLDALPAGLVERFERVGWMLVRNYSGDIGASLADVFGTEDRNAIERYFRSNAIDFAWQDGGLRTRQRRKAVVTHPVSGHRCWFNQIAFLNQWTLAPELREYLVDEYGEERLPFNTCFGNGDPIDADVIQVINETYEAYTVREQWRTGDLLIVDNIRTAHAKEPFAGPREIVVAMADAITLAAR
ncbi:MAG TPA: TauD/TfdA family dioxygenase [Gemmatimonadales bacterium]|nr:TauD/TfdA family dioxygenase [Gemmatimonadales bacterium]